MRKWEEAKLTDLNFLMFVDPEHDLRGIDTRAPTAEKGIAVFILVDPKDAEKEALDEEDLLEYCFLVSHSKKGSRSLLHKRVGCWRTSRLCFGDYLLLTEEDARASTSVTGFCKDCWRGEPPPFEAADESSASDTGSSCD